ncbi:MAG: putative transporter substrate binding protein, partial [Myxococcaceae bacterium]|nr:putative transporter substrate binding protein [Myxococcaceae bacterium]
VGIFVMYSNRVTAEDNVLAGAHGPAGIGIGFKESDSAVLTRNDIVANTAGVAFDMTPYSLTATVELHDNVFALNTVALRLHHSQERVRFIHNDFKDNDLVAEVAGGGDATRVTFERNSWDDYAGYDLDHDGVGDVPFVVKLLSSDLASARPQLRYFHGTASLALYDAIAHAMPFFGSKKLLEDLHPSMKPHREVAR